MRRSIAALLTISTGCWVSQATADESASSYSAYYLGLAYGSEQQTSIEASIDHGFDEDSWASLSLLHTRGDAVDDDQLELDVTGIDLNLGHRFDSFGVSIGGGWLGDEGIAETRKLRASLRVPFDKLRLNVSYERRDIEFDFDNVSDLLRNLDALLERALREELAERFPEVDFGNLINLSAELELDVDIYGLGLNVDLSPSLEAFGSYRHYEYSRPPGVLQLSAGLNRFGDSERAQRVLASINQRLASGLDGLASDFETGLYDHTASVGVDLDLGEHNLVLEYGYDKDAIDDSTAHSLLGQWIAPLSAAIDVRVALGVVDTRTQDISAFLGLGLFFYR